MRFQRLDLIKYGKFSDRSIEFPTHKHDFHLIIGPNEAGKSTLRSAIVDLLFGIPVNSSLSFLHPLKELRLGASISQATDVLEFHRAKAQKQTLRSPQDAVLSDSVLADFLATADRNFFEKMFGLDHTMLVKGGESILRAQDDIGQVLFQAATGVASLGKVRDALLAEADKLWAPRKANDRAYYAAADQLEKATSALKEATVRTKVWSEANGKVEELQEKINTERQHHQQLHSQRTRFERVRRLAPFLIAIKELEQKLTELGEVLELPADAAKVLASAERELAIAQERLELRNHEVESLTDALGQMPIDEAVLAIADDISKIDERRLQYSSYDRDIDRQDMAKSALWRDIGEACAQLGWQVETEHALAERLPTVLVRKELHRLAQDFSGFEQRLQAAEKAESAKHSEIATLSAQLAELHVSEVKPTLRAAIASARAFGDSDSAMQKHKAILNKSQSALETALQELGQWRMTVADLSTLQLPSQQKLSLLLQERQSLLADRKAAFKRLAEHKTKVAGIDLEISQFQALHHPTTRAMVIHARSERDSSWQAIKTNPLNLQHNGQDFENLISQADKLADQRLDDVEEATKLQNLQQQLEREQHNLMQLEMQCSKLTDELQLFDKQWSDAAATIGLTEMALEDIGAWMIKRDKALAVAQDYEDAQQNFSTLNETLTELKSNIVNALRESALQITNSDNLSALRIQAESFIQTIDDAKVRQHMLSDQYRSAQNGSIVLKKATDDAKTKLKNWSEAWAKALAKAGLPEDSPMGNVEGAMELISQIEDKLKKIRLIQERIDGMKADLDKLTAESQRLAQQIVPDLIEQPANHIVQILAQRLNQARETAIEVTRLKKALQQANEQVTTAKEAIQTATASIKPLLERVGVETTTLLTQAITRSDDYRRLTVALNEASAKLVSDGDGLSRLDIEAEIEASNLAELPADLTRINEALTETVQRQNTLSAEQATALRMLSDIGGSDAAAQAEAQRQEALAKMADVAERYIKVFTAGRLLRWSIDRYREEKQGPLLTRAGAIFTQLTLGSFQRLVVDFEVNPPVLEGQRADGKLVGISGLSDGTRDQLYLALRLAALEMHLEQSTPLPFIADDLFINYDDARAKAGLGALADLSTQTQVIFLSHHAHLVPLVQEVFGKMVNVVIL